MSNDNSTWVSAHELTTNSTYDDASANVEGTVGNSADDDNLRLYVYGKDGRSVTLPVHPENIVALADKLRPMVEARSQRARVEAEIAATEDTLADVETQLAALREKLADLDPNPWVRRLNPNGSLYFDGEPCVRPAADATTPDCDYCWVRRDAGDDW